MDMRNALSVSAGQKTPYRYLWTGLFLILAALIAFFLVRAVLVLLEPESIRPIDMDRPALSAAVQNGGASAPFDTRFDPFHPGQNAPIQTDIAAPETTLNLKLFGLRAGDGGSAIIQTPDNAQGVYRIGDTIISGVTLEDITPGYVVIARGGIRERLTFDRDENRAITPYTPEPRLETDLNSNLDLSDPGPDEPVMIPDSPTTPPAVRTNSDTAAVTNGVPDLMDIMFLQNVKKDGQAVGFSITPRGETDLSDYGLQAGDILTSIDGYSLVSQNTNIFDLLEDIKKRDSVEIEILRDDTPMTLKVGL